MSSTIIKPVAQQIAAIAAATGFSDTVAAWTWEPSELGPLPAAVVRLPRVGRKGIEERESQMGTADWDFTFPVDLFFDLADPIQAQNTASDLLEKFIHAIDADQGLSGQALEAKVTVADPSFDLSENRPLVIYECQVEVLKLVT